MDLEVTRIFKKCKHSVTLIIISSFLSFCLSWKVSALQTVQGRSSVMNKDVHINYQLKKKTLNLILHQQCFSSKLQFHPSKHSEHGSLQCIQLVILTCKILAGLSMLLLDIVGSQYCIYLSFSIIFDCILDIIFANCLQNYKYRCSQLISYLYRDYVPQKRMFLLC